MNVVVAVTSRQSYNHSSYTDFTESSTHKTDFHKISTKIGGQHMSKAQLQRNRHTEGTNTVLDLSTHQTGESQLS